MAEKTCKVCDQRWDTREFGECPTCREIRESDLQSERARLLGFGPQDVSQDEVSVVDAVYREADAADSRAGWLENLVNLVASLGILGSVIFGGWGLTSEGGAEGLAVVVALVSIAVWLLVRAIGVAFAARLNLAASLARLEASKFDN